MIESIKLIVSANKKRTLAITIVAIIVIAAAVTIGGRRAEASKLVRQAEASLSQGKYNDALDLYKRSAKLWKGKEIDFKINEMEAIISKIDEYDKKIGSLPPEDPTRCIEYLNSIPSNHPKYEDAQDKLDNCKQKQEELTKLAQEAETKSKAEAEAAAAKSAKSSTKTSSTSSSTAPPASNTQNGQSAAQETSSTPATSPAASPSTNTPDPTASPNLKNLGINFAARNAETSMAGDFRITIGSKVFYEFGAAVPSPTGTKYLHEFTYHIPVGTTVVSPLDGVVTAVRYQADTADYEIDISPFDGSEWFANLDHLINLTVADGSTVSAGDTVGKPQELNDNPGLARVELALLRNTGGEHRRYCPLAGFESSLRSTFAAKIAQHIADFESVNNSTAIYDESTFGYVTGCSSEYVVD